MVKIMFSSIRFFKKASKMSEGPKDLRSNEKYQKPPFDVAQRVSGSNYGFSQCR